MVAIAHVAFLIWAFSSLERVHGVPLAIVGGLVAEPIDSDQCNNLTACIETGECIAVCKAVARQQFARLWRSCGGLKYISRAPPRNTYMQLRIAAEGPIPWLMILQYDHRFRKSSQSKHYVVDISRRLSPVQERNSDMGRIHRSAAFARCRRRSYR